MTAGSVAAASKAPGAAEAVFDAPRRLAAEALGAALLLAVVVGSGIMGERLARGISGLALMCNAVATGAGLTVLIAVLGPISGAHFNPAVTLVLALRRAIGPRLAVAYAGAQLAGAVAGVWVAHLMFAEPLLQVSGRVREGAGQALSEAVATLRPGADDPLRAAFPPRAGGGAGRALYRGGLLVHRIDVLREPRGDDRPGAQRQFRGNRAGLDPDLRRGPAGRGNRRVGPVRVALSPRARCMTDAPVTIYHNPACGSSRNALALIRAAGHDPRVVEYLRTGWTRPELEALTAAMGVGVRALLRAKDTPAAELGLLDPAVAEDEILAAMVAHPILVNRPIVVTPKGTRLCRPSETVLALLEGVPAPVGGGAAAPKPAG